MKSIKKLPIAIAFLVIFMVPIIPSYGSVVPSLRGTEPPRDEIVWGSGGDGEPNTLNPWANEPDPMSQLMLETLFGFNSKDQDYVPCIGTDFEWLNGGLELHIKINPNARWSNGYPISAVDVVKSYQLAYLQPKWGVDFP
ncbi:MAG: hypothetical protein JXA99_10495, partial [Candidatus Lokiarchaeota archaeon]|nr:hypothetical protein [Candidatus Lokiarchaeota archaeon]